MRKSVTPPTKSTDSSDQESGYYKGPGGILAKMYHIVLYDLGIDWDRYEALMRRYIAKAQISDNAGDIVQARTNLNKELTKAAITWKTFVRGLRFLYPSLVAFGIKAKKRGGDEVISASIEFNPEDYEDKNEGELLASLLKEMVKQLGKIDRERLQRTASIDAQAIASLNKELGKSNITWKTVIKGLWAHNIGSVEIYVILHHLTGAERVTTHKLEFELSGADGDLDDHQKPKPAGVGEKLPSSGPN